MNETATRHVLLATSSEGKRRELERLTQLAFPPHSLRIHGAREFGVDLPHIEEDAPDFVGNARLKALGFRRWALTHGLRVDLIIADDSGLCVDALDGRPGVLSARFSGLPAADPELDAANNARLVRELRERGLEESRAEYRCALACVVIGATSPAGAQGVGSDGDVTCVEGRCAAIARVVSRGTGGFGYDPYMWLPDADKTFAELSPDEKGALSHRGRAIRALIACGALGLPALG